MLDFELLNLNPHNRKTGDCSTRALCNILQISYNDALDLQCEMAKKKHYGVTDKENLDWILKDYGFIKMMQPRKANGRKVRVNELDSILNEDEMENGVIVLIANHWTIVRDYKIQDLWDCGDYSVGNYWVKKSY